MTRPKACILAAALVGAAAAVWTLSALALLGVCARKIEAAEWQP